MRWMEATCYDLLSRASSVNCSRPLRLISTPVACDGWWWRSISNRPAFLRGVAMLRSPVAGPPPLDGPSCPRRPRRPRRPRCPPLFIIIIIFYFMSLLIITFFFFFWKNVLILLLNFWWWAWPGGPLASGIFMEWIDQFRIIGAHRRNPAAPLAAADDTHTHTHPQIY